MADEQRDQGDQGDPGDQRELLREIRDLLAGIRDFQKSEAAEVARRAEGFRQMQLHAMRRQKRAFQVIAALALLLLGFGAWLAWPPSLP